MVLKQNLLHLKGLVFGALYLLNKYLIEHEDFHNIKKFWKDHTKAIRQFHRYPHRNKILGRESTEEELAFLNGPNSSW